MEIEEVDSHGILDQSYYQQAFELMKNLFGENASWFFFTDDPEWEEEAFKHLPNAKPVKGNGDSPWEDLYLMSLCDHNIIANNTFCWWAAWINANRDKTVIAPRRWFGREKHKTTPTFDMFPDGWITI